MTYKNRADEGAFLPSVIDDLGLTLHQFRIYYRIKRRAGSDVCWESAANMAKACKMDVKSARKAIRELGQMGLISIHPRNGKTPLISINPMSEWKISHPTQMAPYPNGTQVRNGKGGGGKTDKVPYPNDTHEDLPRNKDQEERPFKEQNEKNFSGSTSTENSQASKPLVACPEKTEASGVIPTTPGKDQYSAPVRVKKTLGTLQGGNNREYQKAMAEKAALTLFQSEDEELSFYRWAKGRFDYNGEQQADIAIARLRNKAKATPRDKELLSQFRNSTSSPQQAPELTRGERMALAAEEYKKDPSMLQKDVVTFRRDHGVSLTNFKCYLFKVGLVG